MNQTRMKRFLAALGSCLVLSVLVLASDAVIAVGRTDPVPASQAAASSAGWDGRTAYVRSVNAVSRVFGHSAVVTYVLPDAEGGELREVHLRRPIFSQQWKIVRFESRS